MSKESSFVTIGDTGLKVPRICFGTSALSDMPDTYGYEVDVERAIKTIHAIAASEAPFLDTSRNYGMGRSEERIGLALRELGGAPDSLIISTKLDRDMDTLKFDGARARRSLEESLAALGVDAVDILHLHDPEHAASVDEITRTGGALDELFKMKEEGLAKAIGLAAGNVDVMMPILRDRNFDMLITHNRKTLVNNNADEMIELAKSRGIAVMNAAPYAGGALAKGSASFDRYVYQKATDEVMAPIRAVEAICKKHAIAPGAAALQYSTRHADIAVTICGVSKPERVEQTLNWASTDISDEAWNELLALKQSSEDPEASREYKAE